MPSRFMIRNIVRINAVGLSILALLFLIYPAVRAFFDLSDPALREPGTPRSAWRLYRNLTPKYEAWAGKRMSDGRAEQLSTKDISGTEWPLFGSVFYLWAVENLENAWVRGNHSATTEPKVFARDAIIAASDLVVDPKQGSWVKKHWGKDYLHRENVFYRMLVIAALTVREKLCPDGEHLDLLRDQVETLSRDLDSSKTGLLDDYPGECYPGDVMAAWMCIKRADAVLGTDHSAMIERALRGFVGDRSTRIHLPPYSANAAAGRPASEARGCASSYMCLSAPELWPLPAREWYAVYDRFFWQEHLGAAGYREFARGAPDSDWKLDVDAGPVVAGYGVAANAFGVGASRKNGRFDRAYPLSAELLATAWELPNGTLLVPRMLSNLSDAPLVGEAAILWQLTVEPQRGFPVKSGGKVPPYVYVVLIAIVLLGAWRVLESLVVFRQARFLEQAELRLPILQIGGWICLLAASVVAFAVGHRIVGFVLLVAALMLPVRRRTRFKGTEDWPKPEEPGGQSQPQEGQ